MGGFRTNLKSNTIEKIAKTLTGDNEKSFYRSGPQLVSFFNELGFNDTYSKGFPSRWAYAYKKIGIILKQEKFLEFVNNFLDDSLYIDTEYNTSEIVKYINQFLKFDGYEIIKRDNKYLIKDLQAAHINFPEKCKRIISTDFLDEQIKKCDKKIIEGDYDGAITNARSMIEEVLLEIEKEIRGKREKYDGNLNNLYKRVKKLVNLDPGSEGLNTPLKQILSGLNNIVSGVGGMRTKASDSHAREYKPLKHHAELAVNSAKTFTSFIISSYDYQKEKN
ncbi:MAG: abortive infection family protein [Kosmotoga sp.]|nr:MAG: abortive infection family protein [Kosmotoga sp.]